MRVPGASAGPENRPGWGEGYKKAAFILESFHPFQNKAAFHVMLYMEKQVCF